MDKCQKDNESLHGYDDVMLTSAMDAYLIFMIFFCQDQNYLSA